MANRNRHSKLLVYSVPKEVLRWTRKTRAKTTIMARRPKSNQQLVMTNSPKNQKITNQWFPRDSYPVQRLCTTAWKQGNFENGKGYEHTRFCPQKMDRHTRRNYNSLWFARCSNLVRSRCCVSIKMHKTNQLSRAINYIGADRFKIRVLWKVRSLSQTMFPTMHSSANSVLCWSRSGFDAIQERITASVPGCRKCPNPCNAPCWQISESNFNVWHKVSNITFWILGPPAASEWTWVIEYSSVKESHHMKQAVWSGFTENKSR